LNLVESNGSTPCQSWTGPWNCTGKTNGGIISLSCTCLTDMPVTGSKKGPATGYSGVWAFSYDGTDVDGNGFNDLVLPGASFSMSPSN
jgi:hypothetical protein